MAPRRRIDRRLRFSLRSLLLIVLGIAAYLGWERWQVATVQRQTAAIRELGGEVLEFDSSAWSLLGFVDPTYGRRIGVAELPAERVQQALPLLKSMSSLRALQVTFDGESGVEPNWELLQRQMGRVTVVPVATVRLGDAMNT